MRRSWPPIRIVIDDEPFQALCEGRSWGIEVSQDKARVFVQGPGYRMDYLVVYRDVERGYRVLAWPSGPVRA
jgi:hypothetical protein